MTDGPAFALSKIKEYVLGICRPFFENYKRIIGAKLKVVDDRLYEIENTGLTEIYGNLEDLDSRVTTIEDTNIPNIKHRLSTLENTTIPDLTERVITIEEESIPGLQNTVNGNSSDITDLKFVTVPQIEDDITGIDDRVTTIEDTILPNHTGRLDTHDTNIADIWAILDSDDSTLDEFQEIVNYIKQNKHILDALGISNIAGLQTALNQLQSQISSNDGNISSLQSTTNTHTNKLTHIEDTILPNHTGRLDTHDTNIADIWAILDSDDSTLDELQEVVNFIKQNKHILDTLGISNIAGLETALQQLETQITSNDNDISALQTRTNCTDTDLDTTQKIADQIRAMLGTLNTLGSDLSDNTTQTNQNKNDIESLETTSVDHENRLNAIEGTSIPNLNQAIQDLENNVATLIPFKYQEATIDAGSYTEIDTWVTFGNNYNARRCIVELRVLDTVPGSPTENMYINADAISTIAIRNTRYIRIINNHTTSLQFTVMVK